MRGKVTERTTDDSVPLTVFVFPPRHFAQKEIKALMALLLIKYTIEADPESTERPVFKEERMGVGVMHPKGDIRVIVHLRE